MSRVVSMEELEALSRLLDGELPPDEEVALRAAIDADPALARAWAAMRSVPGAVAGLPLEIPPARLDERLFTPRVGAEAPSAGAPPSAPVEGGLRRGREPARVGRAASRVAAPVGWAAAAVLAAATLLLVVRGEGEPSRVRVRSGVSHLEGRVDVLAGSRTIALDGEADVKVEPSASGRMGDDPLVSVTVLQGVATVRGPDGSVESLQEGDTRRWGDADGSERPRRAPSTVASTDPDLGRENERLRLENALLRGQLQGHEGVPQPWPTGLPVGYRPEGFETRSEALVRAVPGIELASVDCDEYPCIAFYRLDDPTQPLDQLLREPLTAIWGDDANVMLTGLSSTDDDGRSFSFAAVAATPDEDAPEVDSIRVRVNARIEPTVEEMRGEALRGGEPTP